VSAPKRGRARRWAGGNSAPRALFTSAVETLMLSMVSADAIDKGVEPVGFGVAFMFGYGVFIVIMFVTSLRTSVLVVPAPAILVHAIFLLATGNYGAHANLIHRGGYTGLRAAACTFYVALADLSESLLLRPSLVPDPGSRRALRISPPTTRRGCEVWRTKSHTCMEAR